MSDDCQRAARTRFGSTRSGARPWAWRVWFIAVRSAASGLVSLIAPFAAGATRTALTSATKNAQICCCFGLNKGKPPVVAFGGIASLRSEGERVDDVADVLPQDRRPKPVN